jgi:hypothetical protein
MYSCFSSNSSSRAVERRAVERRAVERRAVERRAVANSTTLGFYGS